MYVSAPTRVATQEREDACEAFGAGVCVLGVAEGVRLRPDFEPIEIFLLVVCLLSLGLCSVTPHARTELSGTVVFGSVCGGHT